MGQRARGEMEEGGLVRRSCRLQQRHREQRGFAHLANRMGNGDSDGDGDTVRLKGRLRRVVEAASHPLGAGARRGPVAGTFGAATDEALLQDLEDDERVVDGGGMQKGTAALRPGSAGARGASAGCSGVRGSGSREFAAAGERRRAPSPCATEHGQGRRTIRSRWQRRETQKSAAEAAPRRLGSAVENEGRQRGACGAEEDVSASLGDEDQEVEDLPVKDSLDSFIVGTLEAEEEEEEEREGEGEGEGGPCRNGAELRQGRAGMPSPGVEPCFKDAKDVLLWCIVSIEDY